MSVTEYDGVIINNLTLEQYKELKANNQKVASQTYVITDLDEQLEKLSDSINPNILKMSDGSINIVNNLTLSISNNAITLNGTSNNATYCGWFKCLNLSAGKYEFGAKIKGGTYDSSKEHYTFAVSNNEAEGIIYPWAIDYAPAQFTLNTGGTVGISFWVDDQTYFNNYQIELYIKKLEEYPEFYWQLRTGRVITNSDCVFFNNAANNFTNIPLGDLIRMDNCSGTTYYLKFIKEGNTYKLVLADSAGAYTNSNVIAIGSLNNMTWNKTFVIFPYSMINYYSKLTVLIEDKTPIDNAMRINNSNF